MAAPYLWEEDEQEKILFQLSFKRHMYTNESVPSLLGKQNTPAKTDWLQY